MLKRIVVVISSGVLATEIMWQLYKVYKHSRRKVINTANGCAKQLCKGTEAKIFEVMFFSKDSTLCRSHLRYMKPCIMLNCPIRHLSLMQLYRRCFSFNDISRHKYCSIFLSFNKRIVMYLDSATDTLDVCVYFFTFPDLAQAIIKAKKRNVVVRMILDDSMAQNDTSQIMNFYKEGIQPKSKPLDVLMHHKFVIIDNNILISGSTNWTKSAFFGNFENVLITNESAIVQPFINEFESIWRMLNAVTTETNSRNLKICH